MKQKFTAAILFLLFSVTTSAANTSRDLKIREMLQDFNANPSAFLEKIPPKLNSKGEEFQPPLRHQDPRSLFLAEDHFHSSMMALGMALGTHSTSPSFTETLLPASAESERAQYLVDDLKARTLEQMASQNLTESNLTIQPWSDSYWPIANGITAWRYADPEFPGGYDWNANSKFILDRIQTPPNSSNLDLLSPAEKYDLLIGDSGQTLTHHMIEAGRAYFDKYGSVESWMGICHGWAAASFMTPRPEHSIELPAADGVTKIRFRPSDIKALTSLLWANGRFSSRFVGSRCNEKDPPKDENGRVIDPHCYGENSATWHLSVVNQLGAGKKPFIINASHDVQVWNQPVVSYLYTLFNPQTLEPAKNTREARVRIERFTNDKFKKYRSPDARWIVGIAMDVTYIAENQPSQADHDSASSDTRMTVRYLYDLELDRNREIVRGEWYSNAHPGFIWTPVNNAVVTTIGDSTLDADGLVESWDGQGVLPLRWKNAATSSALVGQPLAKIIQTLGVLGALANP